MLKKAKYGRNCISIVKMNSLDGAWCIEQDGDSPVVECQIFTESCDFVVLQGDV